jgi:hypothetical protein
VPVWLIVVLVIVGIAIVACCVGLMILGQDGLPSPAGVPVDPPSPQDGA